MDSDPFRAGAVSHGESSPPTFSHPLREYRALTSRAALLDLSHWGVLRLEGNDRVRFLNSMTTNDVAALDPGRACHSAMTTAKGKLVAELFVLPRENDVIVFVSQGDRQSVTETLDKHIIADDVSLEDLSGDFGVFSLEGPACREVVWRLFPDSPLPMSPLQFTATDYQGVPVTILRNSATGEKGLQLLVPSGGAARIRDYLVQSGRAEDMERCGSVAWNMRRIENGVPWWGADVTGDNFPKESRLDHVVSYEKGCYLGQETLARMHHRGHPNRLLVGLRSAQPPPPSFLGTDDDDLPTLDDDAATVRAHIDALTLASTVEPGTELFAGTDASAAEGKPSGRITSLTVSPRLGTALFLGYVRAEHADGGAGREFLFSTGDEVSRATLTQLPIEESK